MQPTQPRPCLRALRAPLALVLLLALVLMGAVQFAPTAHAARATVQACPTVATGDVQGKKDASKILGCGAGGLYDPNDPSKGSNAEYVADAWDSQGNATSWHMPVCAQPPDNSVRDHTLLSDVDLQTYGLLPRPRASDFKTAAAYQDAVTQWQYVVRHSNKRSCTLHKLKKAPTNDIATTHSWSGWGADHANGTTANFDGAWGDFYVASACSGCAGPSDGKGDQVTQWVGVGGADGGCLLQAGETVAWYDYAVIGWGLAYDSWFENTCGSDYAPQGTGIVANSGDDLYDQIGSGTGHTNGWYQDDISTSYYQSGYYGPNPSTQSAECIFESYYPTESSNALFHFSSPAKMWNCVHHDPYHGWDVVGATETRGALINPQNWYVNDNSNNLMMDPSSIGAFTPPGGSSNACFYQYYVRGT